MDRFEDIQAFEQHLWRRSPDRRTPVDYVSDVRQFAASCSKAWREVMMHDIDIFVDQQRQAGLSAATVKRRVAALKVFFDFLAEERGDLAWPNPVRCKRHAGKQPHRLPRELSNSEVERVWAVISKPRYWAWFALDVCVTACASVKWLRCGWRTSWRHRTESSQHGYGSWAKGARNAWSCSPPMPTPYWQPGCTCVQRRI